MKALSAMLAVGVLVGCASPQGQFTSSKAITKKKTERRDCQHTQTTLKCVQVVRVYDGDSFFIDLPDQHPLFGKEMGVRVYGIDTPELRTKDTCEKQQGKLAKKALQNIIAKAERVDLVDVKKDKFFRILAKVHVDGKPVASEMIRQGLAYEYYGTKKVKRNWCQ